MKKLLSCILAAVCALSLFAVTACNRKPTMSNGEELDPNRVQLYAVSYTHLTLPTIA